MLKDNYKGYEAGKRKAQEDSNKKMYLVTLNWYYGADYGLDIHLYDSFHKALDVFLQIIHEEMTDSWISGYLTDDGKADTDFCEFETNLDLKNNAERGLYWTVKQPSNYRVDDLQLSILEVQ